MTIPSVLRRSPALAFLFLVGCTSVGGGPVPSGTIDHPAGSALVFSITTEGGFVPVDTHLITIPQVAITGDGRVIVVGPTIAIYPGPARPNLQERTLTPAGLQHVLERVIQSGLFSRSQQYSGANLVVADAPDTVFRLNAAGDEVVVSVYALGFLDDMHPLPAGISDDEVVAHRLLTELQADMTYLDGLLEAADWADDWHEYQPDALRLLVTPIDEPSTDPLAGDPMPWPLAEGPATFGDVTNLGGNRCGVVSGSDASTWWDALAQANQLTAWSWNDSLYLVQTRPLLPYDEASCPNLAS